MADWFTGGSKDWFSSGGGESSFYARKKKEAEERESANAQGLVDKLLTEGKSFEDISRDTGVGVEEIRAYTEQTRPGYGIKESKSNLSKAKDIGKSLIDAQSRPFKYIAEGTARALGAGKESEGQARATSSLEGAQFRILKVLQDPNVPQERKDILLQALNEQNREEVQTALKNTQEVEAATNKRKFTGATAEVASYLVGGAGIKSAFQAGGKIGAAKALAGTAASGAIGGTGAALQEDNVTPEDVAKTAAVGAGIGVGLSALGFGAGAVKRRIFNDGAEEIIANAGPKVITDERRLLTSGIERLDSRVAEINDRLNQITQQGSEFIPEAKTLDNLGTEEPSTLLADTTFNRNRREGKVSVKSGTVATQTKGEFKSAADEARALVKEREQLQKEIDKINNTTIKEQVASAKTPEEKEIAKTITKNQNQGKKVIAQVPREAGRLKRAVVSVKGQFANMGDGGKRMARALDDAETIAETSVGRWTLEAPSVFKLGKKDFVKFVDALETLRNGGEVKVGSNVQKAIDEWRVLAPKIREEAVARGLDVGDLGEYYFPKNYSQIKGRKNLQSAAQHLVDTGQAENLGEAVNALRMMQKASRTRPYGHLEMERVLDLPTYDKTKKALAEYLGFSGQRIGNAEQFGAKGELADEMIDQIGKDGFDIDRASKNYRIATGQETYGEMRSNISKTARQFNAFRALRTAAISNAGQTTNTASVSGIMNTVNGAFKMFSPAQRKFIQESGTTADAIINNISSQYGLEGIAGKVGAPVFGAVERFNRSLATSAGEVWADKLAKKGGDRAIRQLRRLGVTGDISKTLTQEQRIQAARGLVNRTQFKVGAKDLPAWASSPEGRMISQFRTFSYKQSGFMYNEILKPLSEGNPLPLMRFAAALPIGAGVMLGKNAWRTRVEESKDFTEGQSWTEGVMDAYGSLGALGLAGDVRYAAERYGQQGTGFEESLVGSVGGPTAGYVAGTVFDIADARKGSPEGLIKRGIEAPLGPVGKAVSNRIVKYEDNTLAGNLEGDTGEQLKKLGEEVGYEPKLPSKEQNGRELSDKEYDQYVSTYKLYYSQYLNQVTSTEAFLSASPATKKTVLQQVARRAGEDSRESLYGEKKKLLKGESESTKIFKQAGLR